MYRDTSSVDCAPRELTHACSRILNSSSLNIVPIFKLMGVYITKLRHIAASH